MHVKHLAQFLAQRKGLINTGGNYYCRSHHHWSRLQFSYTSLFFSTNENRKLLISFTACQAQCLALSMCIYLFSSHNNTAGYINLFLMLLTRKLRLEHLADSWHLNVMLVCGNKLLGRIDLTLQNSHLTQFAFKLSMCT